MFSLIIGGHIEVRNVQFWLLGTIPLVFEPENLTLYFSPEAERETLFVDKTPV
ncbi:MAG: hypothetical protein IPH28_23570 [Cytophagaceae bacterium]|nr:hypothetical protein [Cytophagaceae bacterium]